MRLNSDYERLTKFINDCFQSETTEKDNELISLVKSEN